MRYLSGCARKWTISLIASDDLGVLEAIDFFKCKHDEQIMSHLAHSGVEPIIGTVSRFLNRR